jgi:hypothetical protein
VTAAVHTVAGDAAASEQRDDRNAERDIDLHASLTVPDAHRAPPSRQFAAAERQSTCFPFAVTQEPPYCPFGSAQTFAGRQPQVGVPPHAAGRSTHFGAGGVQGGGTQPAPPAMGQRFVIVHPVGQSPASPSGVQTATPPPQLG